MYDWTNIQPNRRGKPTAMYMPKGTDSLIITQHLAVSRNALTPCQRLALAISADKFKPNAESLALLSSPLPRNFSVL
eukprot:3855935-Pyramimonas_sp.AAC.1